MRPIVVQKYGGSSVADLDRIRLVARRIAHTREQGYDVVAVVSAMGNTTNELLELARRLSPAPNRREVDMLISVGERVTTALLAMALHDLGHPAASYTGSQSGIITDESHAAARIVAVRPERLRAALDAGRVPVVAGFQGVSRDREVTTLGRGGTDLSAVALAAALGAEWCEICSDVDGVFSADPRVVPEALRLDLMSLDEALAQARYGARVLYGEAVAYAKRAGIGILASDTARDRPGTRIQVEPLPARFASITTDDQLELFRTSNLPVLMGALRAAQVELRACWRVDGAQLALVDLRNWHDRSLFSIPEGATSAGRVAQVAAVGTEVTADIGSWQRAEAGLNAAGVTPIFAQGSGDALSWLVPPDQATQAQRALHDALISQKE